MPSENLCSVGTHLFSCAGALALTLTAGFAVAAEGAVVGWVVVRVAVEALPAGEPAVALSGVFCPAARR